VELLQDDDRLSFGPMSLSLRDAAFVLLGAVAALFATQNPALAPHLSVVAALLFALYFLSNFGPIRRRVAILRTQDDKNDVLRVLLAEHVRTGNQLLVEVSRLKDEADPLADADRRAVEWANRVIADLNKNRSGWAELFKDETYGMQAVSQFAKRDRILNWLVRRLAKLGELIRTL
jgi:hypothetical protein